MNLEDRAKSHTVETFQEQGRNGAAPGGLGVIAGWVSLRGGHRSRVYPRSEKIMPKSGKPDLGARRSNLGHTVMHLWLRLLRGVHPRARRRRDPGARNVGGRTTGRAAR